MPRASVWEAGRIGAGPPLEQGHALGVEHDLVADELGEADLDHVAGAPPRCRRPGALGAQSVPATFIPEVSPVAPRSSSTWGVGTAGTSVLQFGGPPAVGPKVAGSTRDGDDVALVQVPSAIDQDDQRVWG